MNASEQQNNDNQAIEDTIYLYLCMDIYLYVDNYIYGYISICRYIQSHRIWSTWGSTQCWACPVDSCATQTTSLWCADKEC